MNDKKLCGWSFLYGTETMRDSSNTTIGIIYHNNNSPSWFIYDMSLHIFYKGYSPTVSQARKVCEFYLKEMGYCISSEMVKS